MASRHRTNVGLAVGQGFVGFTILALGVVGTLATVLGFFGSTWWLFDFAANYRAHLAVLLLFAALTYALLFSKATGLFFMAMAVINGLVVLPLYTSSPAPAVAGDDLTIVSFNVGQRASIRELTFRWIDSTDADIVVLIDATNEWVNATGFAAPYQFLNGMPVDRTHGITVLAKEDLEAEVIRVTQIRDVVVRVEAALGDLPIVIYAIHSRPASNEADASLRDVYFAEVIDLASQETDPTVVVGDFQSGSWSHTFRELVSEADLVDSRTGYGIQPTWPADRLPLTKLAFDHLVHSPDLTTVERYLGPALGAEHLPIVVKLAVAG
jgi:endonuclease/exonuclease/phosphatase (EEP) superfamily protein YafD